MDENKKNLVCLNWLKKCYNSCCIQVLIIDFTRLQSEVFCNKCPPFCLLFSFFLLSGIKSNFCYSNNSEIRLIRWFKKLQLFCRECQWYYNIVYIVFYWNDNCESWIVSIQHCNSDTICMILRSGGICRRYCDMYKNRWSKQDHSQQLAADLPLL